MLLVCGILWYLYGISYALVTAVTIGIYVWLTFGITAWRIRIRRKMNDAENEASTRQVDSLLNFETVRIFNNESHELCLLYTSPSPRDQRGSRMPSSA